MSVPRRVDRSHAGLSSVAVWSIGALDQPTIAAARRILSPDELSRMDRGRDAESRDRRLVTRGALRRLVAELLGVDPRSVVLAEGDHGKPHLPAGADHVVQFNATHTGGLSLIAVSDGVPVGIDAEGVARMLELDLAGRICTRSERRRVVRLARVDEGAARELLRTYWVRKEAVAKAEGLGLQLDVSGLGVHGAPRVRGARAGVSTGVTVHDLDVGTDHVAAVAWSGPAELVGGVQPLLLD